jgi:hypothetical protein
MLHLTAVDLELVHQPVLQPAERATSESTVRAAASIWTSAAESFPRKHISNASLSPPPCRLRKRELFSL